MIAFALSSCSKLPGASFSNMRGELPPAVLTSIINGIVLSNYTEYNYMMWEKDLTLEARFAINP